MTTTLGEISKEFKNGFKKDIVDEINITIEKEAKSIKEETNASSKVLFLKLIGSGVGVTIILGVLALLL